MIEGFWIVQYEGIKGNSGGVVVFLKGHALGGDRGYTYIGTYQMTGNTVTAQITVHNFLADEPNVLGLEGDFELLLKGTIEGNTVRAGASVSGQEVAGVVVKLTKVCELPS